MLDESEEYQLIPEYSEKGEETGYYTREPDGVSGMTVSALSELCCLASGSTTTLSDLLTKIEDSDPEANDLSDPLKPFAGNKLRLEANDPQGRLIVPDDVCQGVLEHYAFEARKYQGQPGAVANYRSIAKAGMRIFIWSKTGFIPEPLRQSLRSHTSVYIERLENMRDHTVNDFLWTTFREGAEVLLLVEKELQVPVDQLDLCDGSIGSHWSQFREDKAWRKAPGTYTHNFRDQRGPQECRAYHLEELSYFKKWLREYYIPHHLPEYLTNKFGKLATREIYESIGGLTDRVLEVTEVKRMTPKQEELYQQFQSLRKRLQGKPFKPQLLGEA
jgi:hypothetical protein